MFTGAGVCRVGGRFGLTGAFVGMYPRICIALSLLLIVPAILGYLYSFRADFTLGEGFISPDAPSHREVSVQRSFFGKQNEQWYLALFGVAKSPDGNMLTSAEFDEFDGFYNYVANEMNLTLTSGGGDGNADAPSSSLKSFTYKYRDICQPLCDINEQLQKLMQNSWLSTMRYPVSQVLTYDVNIGKHVFNRTYNNRTGEMTGAKFLAYYFTVFLDDATRQRQVEQFERAVANLAAIHNAKNESRVEIITHGSGGVTNEIQRAVFKWMTTIVYGHGAAFLLVMAISWLSGWYSDEQFTWRRVCLCVASFLFCGAALFSAFGTLLLCGATINILFITSPTITLVFLINIHGAFSITDAWNRLSGEAHRKQFTASERLAATFEQMAASHLLSNAIVCFAFFAAYFILITNYGAYALFVSLTVLFNFLLQTFFYSALLVLLCFPNENRIDVAAHFHASLNSGDATAMNSDGATKIPTLAPIIKSSLKNGEKSSATATKIATTAIEQKKKLLHKKTEIVTKAVALSAEAHHRQQVRKRRQFRVSLAQKIFYPLSKYLSSRALQTSASVIFALLLWCSAHGVSRLENRMDYRNILLNDSPSNRGFRFMDIIWSDILQIVYIVERAPDFENATQYAHFQNFIKDATTLPQAMTSRAHMSWLFDYYRAKLNLNYFGDRNQPKQVNMSEFKNFISTFPYQAWQGGVHFLFKNSSNPFEKPTVERMVVLVSYNDTVGLNGKVTLMRNCRRVASNYSQFRIVAYDTDSQTVDVIEAVPPTHLWMNVCLVMATVIFTICILCHFLAALLTTLAVVSMIIVYYGMSQILASLELDVLSMPAAWTILAQVLFIGTQFVGNYLQCWAKEDQQRRSLEITASALWKTILAWLALSMAPACASLAPLFALQTRLQLLGAFITVAYAILFLPVMIGFVEKCFGTRTFH